MYVIDGKDLLTVIRDFSFSQTASLGNEDCAKKQIKTTHTYHKHKSYIYIQTTKS